MRVCSEFARGLCDDFGFVNLKEGVVLRRVYPLGGWGGFGGVSCVPID